MRFLALLQASRFEAGSGTGSEILNRKEIMEFEYEETRIAAHNEVDREGACELLKEMFLWSQRLSECIDQMHTFLHTQEGDPEDLMQRIHFCKSKLGLMWAVPFPMDNGLYDLVAQSPLTTQN